MLIIGEMRPSRSLAALALFLTTTSCSTSHCRVPSTWVVVAKLPQRNVPPYTPRPVFYGEQVNRHLWSERFWRGPVSTVPYEQMLKDAAGLAGLNPRPTFLFNFADGQSCEELNETREAIAKAAACTPDDPCREGKRK